MGDHRFNPTARAVAEGKQVARALDIGENFALLGTQLIPIVQGDDLAVYLAVVGGKESPISGLQPHPVILREIARVPLGNVRRALAGDEPGSDEAVSRAPATESAPSETSSGLVLLP